MGFVEICVFATVFFVVVLLSFLFVCVMAIMTDDPEFVFCSAWLLICTFFGIAITLILFANGII